MVTRPVGWLNLPASPISFFAEEHSLDFSFRGIYKALKMTHIGEEQSDSSDGTCAATK